MGKYVRVYGMIKWFNEQLSITAYNIRPVTDFNEVGGDCAVVGQSF